MSIELTDELRRQIEDHGRRAYNHECCGFLLGRMDGQTRTVVEAMPAANEWGQEERYHRFTITPGAFLRAEKAARARGLDVVGCYHSHPDAEASPSAYDLRQATWPGFSYIIVSIRGGEPAEMTSWLLREDRQGFEPEPIEAADQQETS